MKSSMIINCFLLFYLITNVRCQISKDLQTMIFYLTERDPNDYVFYGCWCGTSAKIGLYEKTIDESDLCCKEHSICYDQVQDTDETCADETRYRALFSDNHIQCIDHDGTRLRHLCLCDRQAAYCLQKSLSTFDLKNKQINATEMCETTAPELKWDPEGVTVVGTTGVPGTSDRLLNLPFSLIVQSNDTIYVSDQNSNRVQKWTIGEAAGLTVAGQANGEVGSSSKHFSRPGGLAIDAQDNLYVVDINNNRIQLWKNSSSEGITIAGQTGLPGSELNQLNTPFGVARNPRTGMIYIADRDNHRIVSYKMNNSTSGTVVAGGNGPGIGRRQLHTPIGVHYEKFTDTLLIVNYGVHNIVRWKIGEDGWTSVVGSPTGISGTSPTLLHHPIGVTTDRWRNIYVADTTNHRIQFFPANQLQGTTIAGVSGIPGTSGKHLRYPFALALDTDMNLYVSDCYNHRVQKFSIVN